MEIHLKTLILRCLVVTKKHHERKIKHTLTNWRGVKLLFDAPVASLCLEISIL